jgi:dihydroorotase
LAALTCGPAQVLGGALSGSSSGTSSGEFGSLQGSLGQLMVGGVADVCVFDPAAHWTVQPANLRSQGKHTPFAGYELPARVRATLVGGHLAYSAGPIDSEGRSAP